MLDNPSVGGTFHELGGGTTQTNNAASWIAWDLSSAVPANTKAVLIQMEQGGNGTMGVRQGGSSQDRHITNNHGAQFVPWVVLVRTSDRYIEIYGDAANIVTFRLLGYWT